MELAKILQYQKIDMELFKLEKEYSQSKEIDLKNKIIKLFEKKKEQLAKLSSELDELLLQLAKSDEKLDACSSGILNDIAPEKASNEKELFEVGKTIKRCEDEINSLSSELNKILKRISEINTENRKTNEEMIALNNEYRLVNNALENKKNDMLAKAKPIVLQLKALLPDLESPEFDKYKEIRKSKKMPAYVVYQNGNCGACGMEIAIEVGNKLQNVGDVAECPHCGRMVYKYQ